MPEPKQQQRAAEQTQPPVTYTQSNYQQRNYQQPATDYYSQQVPTYSNTYIYENTPYAYDSYPYGYYYPGYGYPYYPFYGGVFLGLSFHDRDHFGHHGFEH